MSNSMSSHLFSTAKPLESFLMNASECSITSAHTTRFSNVENDKQRW